MPDTDTDINLDEPSDFDCAACGCTLQPHEGPMCEDCELDLAALIRATPAIPCGYRC